MVDKRRSGRVAITALAETNLPDGRTLLAYVANMNREGVSIYFREHLEAGTEISITLSYDDESGKRESTKVGGQVKWSYNGFFAVGIAFKGLNEKEHGDLLQSFGLLDNVVI